MDKQELEALNTLTKFASTLNNDTSSTHSKYFHVFSTHISLTNNTTDFKSTIIDTGAYPMMFTHPAYFHSLLPWDSSHPIQSVILADGTTQSPIKGISTVKFILPNNKCIELHNTLFVPNLSSNLFSIKAFIIYKQCGFTTENSSYTLFSPISIFPIMFHPNFSFPPNQLQ